MRNDSVPLHPDEVHVGLHSLGQVLVLGLDAAIRGEVFELLEEVQHKIMARLLLAVHLLLVLLVIAHINPQEHASTGPETLLLVRADHGLFLKVEARVVVNELLSRPGA